MRTQIYSYQQNQNQKINDDNFNNIKNILILMIIIIFAYLIQKFYRNVFINTIYLLIILIIVAVIVISLLPDSNNLANIKNLFLKNFNYIPSKMKGEIEKEKLQKVRNIYESGYIFSKTNNYNSSDKKPIFNRQESNYNYNYFNNDNQSTYDNLENKISNINKINDGPLINSFYNKYSNEKIKDNQKLNNKNDFDNNNNYDFNFNNNNNGIIESKIYTNLPSTNSINNNFNQSRNIDNNQKKETIVSPFNMKTKLPPSSSSSSGKYYLFSNNDKKNEKQNLNIISDFNNINPLNRSSYIQSISEFGNYSYENYIKKIPKNKEISYFKFQNLKNKYSNTQALNQDNNMLKYNIDKIPRDLANINYKNWIIKMKNFISRNLIPNIITKHDENISNLNSILSVLGIELASSLTDEEGEEFLRILKEKLYFLNSNKIEIDINKNENKLNNILYNNAKYFYENNLKFPNKDNPSNISTFPSLMNFSNYLNDIKESNNNFNNNKNDSGKQLKKIFFGDTNKIKQILAVIENKINTLEIERNNEHKSTSYHQRQKIIKGINIYNNPFLSTDYTKNTNSYFKRMNDTNNFSLTNLQRLLYERIIINERLYPKELFSKKDETHALLVIEYAIERFKQLQQDFNLYGNGSRGGDFLNENWCSLLPTDSQLIAHLIINYIETIYQIDINLNQQIFLLSYPSNYNILTNNKIKNPKIQTSIFLYQINPPNVEPKFNVVFDGNLIPCDTKDINLFHAFSIYFYLLSSNSAMFVMNLGIHGFINELLK